MISTPEILKKKSLLAILSHRSSMAHLCPSRLSNLSFSISTNIWLSSANKRILYGVGIHAMKRECGDIWYPNMNIISDTVSCMCCIFVECCLPREGSKSVQIILLGSLYPDDQCKLRFERVLHAFYLIKWIYM